MSKLAIGARSYETRSESAPGPVALVAFGEPRTSLAAILQQEDFDFRGFDNVESLLRDREAPTTQLIVLSVDDAMGLASTIEPLRRSLAHVPTIVVCASIERRGVRGALAAGATGVVLQESVEAALAPSIWAALAGQTCVPRRYGPQIEPPALSSREKQILGLVVMGYTNGQIARQLFLAESTVKSHLSSAFGKLGVRSRNEAVSFILDPDHGLGMGILGLGGEPIT